MSKLTAVIRDSRGVTLMELVVYIGLLVSFTSVIGVGFFHATNGRESIENDGYAVNELRRGLGWFADDVSMSREATVVADELTLGWKDYYAGGGDEHSVTYQFDDEARELIRAHSINSIPESNVAVARRVVGFAFEPPDPATRIVKATLTVDAGANGTRSMSISSVMKPEP